MITISLNPDSGQPMYIQIYEYIKAEILTGRLSPPEKLPSSRSLASYLQVSRSTVDTAYGQLVAEGYIEAKEKRGYFVNPITHTQKFPISERKTGMDYHKKKQSPSIFYDFNPDAIDTTHFPYSVWKSIGKNQLDNPDNFLMGDSFGDPELRQVISDYLHGSRGVNCTPENIVVGAGLDHLLQMLCVLFERRPVIAMEDPGYLRARQVLCAGGYRVLDIPLKDNAFDVDRLEKTEADICYVTPTHQFPLGSIMPISRRQKLLLWASERENRYIIEDDHDSEFRYKGKPIPALQSLDSREKVIYIGTFSKAISPAIRMGYMVLPPLLMERYRRYLSGYACPVSRMGQAIMTDFIRDGYFEKHLNRMRKIYKGKHDKMIEYLTEMFPCGTLDITGDHAGLYILLHYHGPLSEEELDERAKKNGIRLRSLREYYANVPAGYHPTYLLGFANLDEKQMKEGITCLARKVFLSHRPYPS
ncbi:MAG: PLP-dependent aminotransferase family protein [Lachnospiraceae bacterium]|nr:PLP-dependent aminotransferase family protein [Lachnospiraceae bacterium]